MARRLLDVHGQLVYEKEVTAMDGWIKLPRSILEEDDYFTKPFTRKEAILDLYLLAAIKDGTVAIGGKKAEVKRGQIITTTRWLAERWGWSKGTLDRFMRGALFGAHFGALGNSAFTCISVRNMMDEEEERGAKRDAKRGAPPIINKNVYLKEYYYDARVRACVREDGDELDTEVERMTAEQSWLENIMMNHHTPPSELGALFAKFVTECRCNGVKSHNSIEDAKRHFNSWLRIYKEHERNERNRNNRPSPEDNLREAEWAAAVRTANAIRGTNEIVDDLPKPF